MLLDRPSPSNKTATVASVEDQWKKKEKKRIVSNTYAVWTDALSVRGKQTRISARNSEWNASDSNIIVSCCYIFIVWYFPSLVSAFVSILYRRRTYTIYTWWPIDRFRLVDDASHHQMYHCGVSSHSSGLFYRKGLRFSVFSAVAAVNNTAVMPDRVPSSNTHNLLIVKKPHKYYTRKTDIIRVKFHKKYVFRILWWNV